MTKKIIKFLLFPLVVLLVIWAIVVLLTQVASDDEARIRLYYHEKASSIDVTFIGSSVVRAGIIPTLAYEVAGFTSYDFAINSLPLNLVKPILQECEIVQKSKLYVIDMTNITYETTENEVAMQKFLNAVPSKQRRRAYVKQLVDKDDQFKWKDKLYAFHSNWQNLGLIIQAQKAKINNRSSVLKGAGFSLYEANIDTSEVFDANSYTQEKEPLEKNLETLECLLYFIEQNNLNVKFIKSPKFYTPELITELERTNYAERVLKERGFEVVDYCKQLNRLEIDENDFYNVHHLNLDGAIKFTTALAQDIVSMNLLPECDHSKEVQGEWDDCVTKVNQAMQKLRDRNYSKKQFVLDDISYFTKVSNFG